MKLLTETPSKMSPAKAVVTDKAPKPLPQFSSAVEYNGLVYCSGSLGLDPKTFAFVEGGVKEQTVSLSLIPVYKTDSTDFDQATSPQEPSSCIRGSRKQPTERGQGEHLSHHDG